MSEPLGFALIGLGFLLFVVMAVGLWIAPSTGPMRESPLNLKSRPPALPVEETSEPFKKIETLAVLDRADVEQEAKSRLWLRPVGFVTRLLTYAALFLMLYLWAPKDISNTPLGTLTLSDITGTAIFLGIGIVLVRALFNPSDDEQVKDAWGWFGVLVLCLVGLGTIFFIKAR